jgi:molecular chaperone DnaK (HSP70)
MLKTKRSAILSLALVFLSGSVLGAVAQRLYMVKTVLSSVSPVQPNKRPDPEEIRKHMVQEARERLKLDDQQVKQLDQIYEETREQVEQARHKANAEMRTIWDTQVARTRTLLRPDQIPLYEQLRAERETRRRNHPPGGGPGGPPPPGDRK